MTEESPMIPTPKDVSDAMIEAGRATYLASFASNDEGWKVWADVYLAMKALDATLTPAPAKDAVTRAHLIGFLNAFKADPFSTGADKVDRLLEIVATITPDLVPSDGEVDDEIVRCVLCAARLTSLPAPIEEQ